MSENLSPSIGRTKLFFKRMLAGTIDLTLFSLIGSVALGLLHIKGSLIFIIYTGILHEYKTTPGGMIAGLKITPINDLKNPEIGLGKAMWRAAIVGALLAFFGISLIELKSYPEFFLIFLITIIINIIPFFFTEKRLMLHDFITRSFVKNDSESTHKYKWVIWLALAILIIANAAANFLSDKKTKECSTFYDQGQYQKVISDCDKASETSRDENLNFIVGSSYFKLGNLDKAIERFRSADIYGHTTASHFIVLSYMRKGDFEIAINISKTQTTDPVMMFLAASSYLEKFEKSANRQDLMNAAIYSKASILLKQKMSGKEAWANLAKSFPLDGLHEKIETKALISLPQEQLDIDESAERLLLKRQKKI